uniref:Uncharacterized protein n=1 Tax=Ananas comosus var. bracteatus TaxID=296719 RepID=A0A6V7NQ26_ANACO|nr:unnamed protein product [Ananas comosus var. bracteatus]
MNVISSSSSSSSSRIYTDPPTDSRSSHSNKMRRKAPSPDSEPTSVLDRLPSFSPPPPPTTTSAALPPFPSAAIAGAGDGGGGDPGFLRWLMADADGLGFGLDPAVPPLAAPSAPSAEQVVAAAEMVDSGDLAGARGILARLNHHHHHHLPSAALRAAVHFSGALLRLLLPPALSPPSLNPVLDLGARKAFADVSPGAADPVHVVDFDVGVGARWPALIRELSRRPPPLPAFRITAVVAAHHLFDLRLVRDNLAQFAAECGVPFEFNAVALDAFDPQVLRSVSGQFDESVFVTLPIGHTANLPIQSLLPLIKQLNPKLVISVNHLCGGGGGGEFSFARHVFNSLQSATALLESIDAAGMSPDIADMIERFILLPRIENAVLGFHDRSPAEKMMTWRTLFASAGLVPVQLSNLAEAQAECLLRRHPIRGFHVEQREATLVLCWQHGRELVSVSAWR